MLFYILFDNLQAAICSHPVFYLPKNFFNTFITHPTFQAFQ